MFPSWVAVQAFVEIVIARLIMRNVDDVRSESSAFPLRVTASCIQPEQRGNRTVGLEGEAEGEERAMTKMIINQSIGIRGRNKIILSPLEY